MKIRRNRAGTQIVWARPASALTVASATVSGVVANGAGDMPAVIRVFTNPGTDDKHAHAARRSRVGEPWASVRLASPQRCLRRDWRSSPASRSEHPYRGHDDVEPAGLSERPLHHLAMVGDVVGVEDVDDRVGTARLVEPGRGLLETGPVAAQQVRAGRTIRGQTPDDREPDFRSAAQQQYATRRVAHNSPVRRARSERQRRSGSARSRAERHSSSRGYIAAQRLRAQPRVLRQVDAPPRVRLRAGRIRRAAARSRARPAGGRARASTPRAGTTAARRWRGRSP